MRVGSLVYASDQGLGYLAKSFHDHGVITDPVVVRHGRHVTHDEWYPGVAQVPVRPFDLTRAWNLLSWAKHSVDVLFFLETPFAWELIPRCRGAGIPTALMPMYECFPKQYFNDPTYWPDLFVCPSLLDWKTFAPGLPSPSRTPARDPSGRNCCCLSVPVSVPWRQRESALVYVHNAGNGGLKGRNGTRQVWQALRHVNNPVRLILRYQERVIEELPAHATELKVGNVTVDCRPGTAPADTLWDEGDVFVFPEKFNGLSLPLQEARAAGMLVMAADRFPMNQWLPTTVHYRTNAHCPLNDPETYCNNVVAGLPCDCPGPLVPVEGYVRNSIGPAYLEFDEAITSPRSIAAKMDEWFGKDLTYHSLGGRLWAEGMSWEALGPVYSELLGGLKS